MILEAWRPDHGAFTIFSVYRGGEKIAWAIVDDGRDYVDQVFMDEEYRGRGIGALLYDYMEFKLGFELRPSSRLSAEADKFWKRRLEGWRCSH